MDWKWSSGWLESWEGLLLATDVSTTGTEAIFRVKFTWHTKYCFGFGGKKKVSGVWAHQLPFVSISPEKFFFHLRRLHKKNKLWKGQIGGLTVMLKFTGIVVHRSANRKGQRTQFKIRFAFCRTQLLLLFLFLLLLLLLLLLLFLFATGIWTHVSLRN